MVESIELVIDVAAPMGVANPVLTATSGIRRTVIVNVVNGIVPPAPSLTLKVKLSLVSAEPLFR